MWISRESFDAFTERFQQQVGAVLVQLEGLKGENKRLEVENTRLRGDLDWFKLRLNAVEKERAQLIAAAIGVKISIPEFLPAQGDKLSDALHEMPDLSTIGNDAHQEEEGNRPLVQHEAIDYSQMPGYRANR